MPWRRARPINAARIRPLIRVRGPRGYIAPRLEITISPSPPFFGIVTLFTWRAFFPPDSRPPPTPRYSCFYDFDSRGYDTLVVFIFFFTFFFPDGRRPGGRGGEVGKGQKRKEIFRYFFFFISSLHPPYAVLARPKVGRCPGVNWAEFGRGSSAAPFTPHPVSCAPLAGRAD